MNQCQNCGHANVPESQFCRFCGTKVVQRQYEAPQRFEENPPRPYAWKTDEFQTQPGRRVGPSNLSAPPVHHAANVPVNVSYGTSYVGADYHCPFCSSHFLPHRDRRVSTAGWIVFAALLVLFFPLFWIGLLIKEDVYVCPFCRHTLPA